MKNNRGRKSRVRVPLSSRRQKRYQLSTNIEEKNMKEKLLTQSDVATEAISP
jgi:hypothetical protein